MGFSKSKVDNTTFWIGTLYRHRTHNVRSNMTSWRYF